MGKHWCTESNDFSKMALRLAQSHMTIKELCLSVNLSVVNRWATWWKWPRSTWTVSGRASAKGSEATSPSPTFGCWSSPNWTTKAERDPFFTRRVAGMSKKSMRLNCTGCDQPASLFWWTLLVFRVYTEVKLRFVCIGFYFFTVITV